LDLYLVRLEVAARLIRSRSRLARQFGLEERGRRFTAESGDLAADTLDRRPPIRPNYHTDRLFDEVRLTANATLESTRAISKAMVASVSTFLVEVNIVLLLCSLDLASLLLIG
jgi:hypothetical protein